MMTRRYTNPCLPYYLTLPGFYRQDFRPPDHSRKDLRLIAVFLKIKDIYPSYSFPQFYSAKLIQLR